MRTRRLWIAILAAASLPAAEKQKQIKPGFNLFSREQDIQLGKEAAQEVERQVTVVTNQPQLSSYVADLGARLARVSQAPDYPYTFKVVAEKGINAFALPGGPIYVHAATIAAADNEAQLAGVIAHEISHVALRHSTHQATKAYGMQILLSLAGATVGSGSLLGQLTQIGLGFGANSLMLKYSRDAEHDADIVGARTMAAAGYDPVEMARFFEKLEKEGGGGPGLQFLSDHPNPGNRVKYVSEEVRLMPNKGPYSKGSGNFVQYKSLAARIPVSERRPAPGGAAAGPAGQWQEYRGRGFALQHPGNWRVFEDRSGSSVTIAPQQGIAQGPRGGAEIKVGVMAGYYAARASNASQAVDELVQDLLSKDPDLRILRGQRQAATLGGVRGESLTLVKTGELDTLVAAQRPGGLFYLILISPESDYNALRPTLQQIQASVRFQ